MPDWMIAALDRWIARRILVEQKQKELIEAIKDLLETAQPVRLQE